MPYTTFGKTGPQTKAQPRLHEFRRSGHGACPDVGRKGDGEQGTPCFGARHSLFRYRERLFREDERSLS